MDNCWNYNAKEAPHDGTPILIEWNYLTPSIGLFNPATNGWVVHVHRCDLFNGEWSDNYMEAEHISECDIKAWLPIPSLD